MSAEHAAGALPDFLVVGRMKSGTTTLGRWLTEQPEVFFCPLDEPRFFNTDAIWAKGVDWYAGLFRGAGAGDVVGEGSPGYTHPLRGPAAAERIRETLPDVRLIYLLRHPVERMRSEYRHRRIMGDEQRSFLDALRDPRWHYVQQSMYFHCLSPYIDRFPRDQILVVRTEHLNDDGEGSSWHAVLRHIGLEPRPVPVERHQVSSERGLYRGPVRLHRNVAVRRAIRFVPAPVRRIPKALLSRRGKPFADMLDESTLPVPEDVAAPIWHDIERLEAWLDVDEPLWER